MFDYGFWKDFLSNGLSTLIVGTILGALATIIINKKSRMEDYKLEAYKKELSTAKKKLAFLSTLKDEVCSLIVGIPLIMSNKYN